MSQEFTPKQVSEITGIPKSTLRRYSKEFAVYLSDSANQPLRNYTGQDIHTLEYIRSQSNNRVSLDDIKSHLQTMVFDDQYELPEDFTPPVDKRTVSKEANQEIMLFDAFEQALKAKDQHIAYLESEIERLRRPWWRRLFGGD